MSPTCSSRFLVGRKTLSAAALTTRAASPPRAGARPPARRLAQEAYAIILGTAKREPGQPRARVELHRRAKGPWYVPAALEARRAAFLTCAATLALGACGGGERQDENEPEVNFQVELVDATFPSKQKLAKRSNLILTVRNDDDRTIPNIAVTVDGFDERKEDPDLADPERPVFVVNGVPVEIGGFPESKEAAPRGCDTAYVNTWACGRLAPGDERTFKWTVTAVEAGPYKISYTVSAGLDGKAKAVDPSSGGRIAGVFSGTISDKPPQSRVAEDGETVVEDTR